MKAWYLFRWMRVIALWSEVIVIVPWWSFKRHVLGYKQVTNQDKVAARRAQKARRQQFWEKFWSFLDQPSPDQPAHTPIDERESLEVVPEFRTVVSHSTELQEPVRDRSTESAA